MSTLETILSRMMHESDFAEAVFTDAENALAEYELSADDLTKFKGLTRSQFEGLTPEDRKSMIAFVGGWGSSMYQYANSAPRG